MWLRLKSLQLEWGAAVLVDPEGLVDPSKNIVSNFIARLASISVCAEPSTGIVPMNLRESKALSIPDFLLREFVEDKEKFRLWQSETEETTGLKKKVHRNDMI